MIGAVQCWTVLRGPGTSVIPPPACSCSGRWVTSGCALEKGESEHLAPSDLVDTFIEPLVCVDRGRYAAEVVRPRRPRRLRGTTLLPACHGSRLRSNGSKAELVSVRLEKLRAWFAPADGEDVLWLWLPRFFW